MQTFPTIRRGLALTAAAAVLATGAVVLTATPAQAATVSVATSAQLTKALAQAAPGQVIQLADGTYTGTFTAGTAGTASAPITLVGSSRAVLTTGSTSSGYALHVTSGYWNLTGFAVATASKGVVLDNADHTTIDGLDIGSIGQEALHVRASSSTVVIRNSVIHDTGLVSPSYGEGIYIGSAVSNWDTVMGSSTTADRSDNALIQNNTVRNTSAEGIDVKEGTTGGRVLGNTFDNAGYSGANYGDSWVDVKGNGYTLTGNSGKKTLLDAFQVHTAVAGWGNDNSFANNTVISGVPGFEVNVQSGAAGTTVACDSSAAAKGLTNIVCSGGAAPAPAPTTTPSPAPSAGGTGSVTANGALLAGSNQARTFTIVANAPAGSTVKFKVDGVYLGLDKTAPYSWTVTTGAGSHKANVRWDANGAATSVDATFTVK